MAILKTVLRTKPWFLKEPRLVSPGEPRLRITPKETQLHRDSERQLHFDTKFEHEEMVLVA